MRKDSKGHFTGKKSVKPNVNLEAENALAHEKALKNLKAKYDADVLLLQACHETEIQELNDLWEEDVDYFNSLLSEQEEKLRSKTEEANQLTEDILFLNDTVTVAASKNSIQRIVEVFSDNIQQEINNIASWSQLGTRQLGPASGKTRDKQQNVRFYLLVFFSRECWLNVLTIHIYCYLLVATSFNVLWSGGMYSESIDWCCRGPCRALR